MLNHERKELAQPLPGEGDKLKQFVKDHWQEHLIQLAPVDNIVLWVNPAFEQPQFNLKKGEPNPLGLFAERAFEDKPSFLPQRRIFGEAWEEHGRSVILNRASITDRENNRYRDIDLKGVGSFRAEYYPNPSKGKFMKLSSDVGNYLYFSGNWDGLYSKESANYDKSMGEKLLVAGIRVPRIIGIIELKELFVGERKYPIEEFKRQHGIEEEVIFVAQVRAFGTRTRIQDLSYKLKEKDFAKLLIDDAIKLINEEGKYPKISSYDEYVAWYGRTMGRNFGLMHKNNWSHGYLTPHNLTLDCRIVDFDSVRKNASYKRKASDLYGLIKSFNEFAIDLPEAIDYDWKAGLRLLLEEAKKGYHDEVDHRDVNDYFSQAIGEWLEACRINHV